MSIELKEHDKGYTLYINGQPEPVEFEYYNNEYTNGDCLDDDTLLQKIKHYPCLEYPDKLDIWCSLSVPLLNGLTNNIAIKRNGKTFSLEYYLVLGDELLWNPRRFMKALSKNIIQYGVEPSPNYDEDDCDIKVSRTFRWHTQAEGSIEEKINESIALFEKALRLTEDEFRYLAGEFSIL